ncbi:mitochondrial F1F0-ATP synthase, subunit G/ATP20 [Heterobasidion irregulare TC 32-1]|uniref:Mitochondrial F1F0-ATP synthase, subunit G/ATP20 n=1 Tax=Heterobasidion irregulare (strain TC 32-1) TaxID=747525 RepID=W4KAY6_HETIT|nr:mitochondrial F1F0-ATP synthase, subunit G/ATP20 [Heterobasidion irregulare TC 32-1]ETW82530.1 mitochondrial F1F0-ATP synthase, subunit G/ATP20 [Heterobasidion irregulare TC 32-1]
MRFSSAPLRLAKPRALARAQPKRLASSNSTEAAQKKAQEALTSAQKVAEKAWAATRSFLGPVGERFSGLLGAYRQPLTYNLSVTREVLKQIYVAERLQPPTSVSQVTSAYLTLWRRAASPSYWREVARSGEWARIGVYAAEAYGIYKIGEIIGRRSLVGYKVQ